MFGNFRLWKNMFTGGKKVGKKSTPECTTESDFDVFEDEISEVFPLQELKTLLREHGYTMGHAVGLRFEGDQENTVVLHLDKRVSGKDGINAFVGFSHDA
jgi:hypothetical protein